MKIGLSSCGKELKRELFAQYRAAGIEAIEICTSYDKYDSLNYEDIKNFADEYGVELWSYHLPFSPFSRLEPSVRELQEGTLAYFGELIRLGANIGIKRFVVHPSGEPIAEADREARMECSMESMYRLAEIAREFGATVAVENLPRTCLGRSSDEILRLISVHSELRVCFDTNHLLSEDPVRFIERVGDKIITTHVSDYDLVDERHWLPGEGKTDWAALYSALVRSGYNGAWLYELSFDTPKNMPRVRPLFCRDFYDNATSIFALKSPRIVPIEVK